MKHVKLFEQFVNEKKELYTAYIEDGREPGGTDKEIKKDYDLEVTNRTKDGFDVTGAKQDVEDFIEEYGIITDVTVYESVVNEDKFKMALGDIEDWMPDDMELQDEYYALLGAEDIDGLTSFFDEFADGDVLQQYGIKYQDLKKLAKTAINL